IIRALAQFVEQARVLDGDDGLLSEILQQLDLLVSKGVNLLTENVDDADKLVFPEHRDGEYGSKAAKLNGRGDVRIAFEVSWTCGRVGDVDHLLRSCHTVECRVRPGADQSAPALLYERRRRIVKRGRTKAVSIAEIQHSELGLANLGRILQHRLEHRLQSARRA